MQKIERLFLRCEVWYTIISRKDERTDYMDKIHNAHSVYLMYYHLIMVVNTEEK